MVELKSNILEAVRNYPIYDPLSAEREAQQVQQGRFNLSMQPMKMQEAQQNLDSGKIDLHEKKFNAGMQLMRMAKANPNAWSQIRNTAINQYDYDPSIIPEQYDPVFIDKAFNSLLSAKDEIMAKALGIKYNQAGDRNAIAAANAGIDLPHSTIGNGLNPTNAAPPPLSPKQVGQLRDIYAEDQPIPPQSLSETALKPYPSSTEQPVAQAAPQAIQSQPLQSAQPVAPAATAPDTYTYTPDKSIKWNAEQRHTFELNNAGNISEARASGADTIKSVTALNADAMQSQKMIHTLDLMEGAMKNFESGKFTDAKTELARTAKALGYTLSPEQEASLSSKQAFMKWANTLVADAAKAEGGASRLMAAYRGLVEANPNVNIEPAALRSIFGGLRDKANYSVNQQKAWADEQDNNPNAKFSNWNTQYVSKMDKKPANAKDTAAPSDIIATNPKTGEKLILKDGAWKPL